METPDVLIIGAGIIGCSLARELARARVQVTIVERGQVGGASSSAAAGLLSPSLATAPAGPLADLLTQSAALYEPWVRELTRDGADEVGFRRQGLLDIWLDPQQAQRHTTAGATSGRRIELLSAQELRRREPAVEAATYGAAFYPDDAQVDAARLTRAVARAAESAGVSIREHEPVRRIIRKDDRVAAIHTAITSYHPGQVVLTAGAWTGGLAESLGLELPTYPVKGQMLQADCRAAPVRTPLCAGHALVVPRADGSLLLGVTVEEAGYDDRVTLDGVQRILRDVCALVPAVGKLPWGRAWAGLRPATPDGMPYLGPVPPLADFWVSTGHYRKGTLLAPVCARLLAQSILAGHLAEELEPFKPTRRQAR